MDQKVYEQVTNVATLPGIIKSSYAMPDAHWGYGFPIGGVAAFDPDHGGVISAGGVGFDISCAVRTLHTGLTVTEIEPLSFILSRLLNQLCLNLQAHALATNELQLRLKLEDRTEQERAITLPVPIYNPKTLLRLLLFEIEAQPPQAAISSVTIAAQPVQPRVSQTGLFIPLAPEPEKLELTLARLVKLVGADKVGSPELLDTHRPDAFRIKRFTIAGVRKRAQANPRSGIQTGRCVMGFRVFRPPWRAEVQTMKGQPTRINARDMNSSCVVQGRVNCVSGPWRTSGDWWRTDLWARDEWDIAVADSMPRQGDLLCRIYRDLQSEEWFIDGMYD
jgi:protein ImuB